MKNVYLEEARQLPVYDSCDLLIVGGGAAGHSAAIAAARAGCKNIILMERYGYSGGDVTGGYVIMVPDLSWYDKQVVRGLQEEWFKRLEKIPGAVRGPREGQFGSMDPLLCDGWKEIHDCWSRSNESPHRLVRSVYFEPNQLKIEMDKMLLEEKNAIRVMYHSLGTAPIMEGNSIRGVVFESKEGRKAIYAKIVIDATGDGDIFSQTGAPYASLADAGTRSSTTALVWRVAGINWSLFEQWKRTRPEAFAELRSSVSRMAGFRAMPLPTNSNEMCWINNWHPEMDCTKIADQTKTEMETRNTMREVLEYLREAVPMAFGKAYLYDIAPQLGCRCSRRLVGEYVMNITDWAFAHQFDDVIAWHSTICTVNDCGPVEIPYRAILPKKIEGMLCPGRHLSADDVAIDWLNLIPQCVGTGQAAGVASAVALKDGSDLHHVDIKKVQDILVDQDVPLPRNEKFLAKDADYQSLVEEKQYGLYTELAQQIREKGDSLKDFRQW
ncbi:MAG: FAD-dependent oxidoreductase [Clostridiales bacterium]|nr:FAD-dependent oxidoreductase [Clostridiales bacterium]